MGALTLIVDGQGGRQEVEPDVELVLCGVRGSTAAPGEDHVRTGGHTSCVAIRSSHGRWLVLDAGTGIRRLGSMLGDAPLRGSILLTHLHWDHTQGLPFVPQADRPDADIDRSERPVTS